MAHSIRWIIIILLYACTNTSATKILFLKKYFVFIIIRHFPLVCCSVYRRASFIFFWMMMMIYIPRRVHHGIFHWSLPLFIFTHIQQSTNQPASQLVWQELKFLFTFLLMYKSTPVNWKKSTFLFHAGQFSYDVAFFPQHFRSFLFKLKKTTTLYSFNLFI